MKLKRSRIGLTKLQAFAFALAAFAPAAFAFAQAGSCTAGEGCRLILPSTGVYMGIRPYPDITDSKGHLCTGNEKCAIEVRERRAPFGIDRKFALHLHYYGWTALESELARDPTCSRGGSDLCDDFQNGRVPVISWECDDSVPPKPYRSTDQVIAEGNQREFVDCAENLTQGWPFEYCTIRNTADLLKEYPGPVLLRWFWEFNLLKKENKSCLGHGPSKNPILSTPMEYTDFKGAWQNIWNIFEAEQVPNVMFLWNPGNYIPCPPGKSQSCGIHDPHNYYPGSAYVDWIGIDTYQRETSETFAYNFGQFYGDFKGYGKPLMVGENGSPNYAQNTEEVQATYLGAGQNGLLADFESNPSPYPELKAYDYFDSDSVGKGKRNTNSWVLDPPSTYIISSISTSGNIVTVVLSKASGITAGEDIAVAGVAIAGVSQKAFDGGKFEVLTSSGNGTTLQYAVKDDAKLPPSGPVTGGTVETAVCEPKCRGVAALTALGASSAFNAIPQSYASMPSADMVCTVSAKIVSTLNDLIKIDVETASQAKDPGGAANCPWSIGPLPSWIKLRSPTQGQGIGPCTVILSVLSVTPLRQHATIEIGGAFVTITE